MCLSLGLCHWEYAFDYLMLEPSPLLDLIVFSHIRRPLLIDFTWFVCWLVVLLHLPQLTSRYLVNLDSCALIEKATAHENSTTVCSEGMLSILYLRYIAVSLTSGVPSGRSPFSPRGQGCTKEPNYQMKSRSDLVKIVHRLISLSAATCQREFLISPSSNISLSHSSRPPSLEPSSSLVTNRSSSSMLS